MKHLFILLILAFPASLASSQTKVLPLGESTTAASPGYRMKFCDLVKADGLSVDMIGPNSDGSGLSYDGDNAGFIGFTCSKLINKLDLFYADYHPDIVLLLEGTNDCGWAYRTYKSQFAIDGMMSTPLNELSLLIDEICLKYPNAMVFVSSIPPMLYNAYVGEPTNTPAGVARANAMIYNNGIPGLINAKIADGKKVYFVDNYSVLNDSDVVNIFHDGIHPNQTGYNKIGEFFYNTKKPFITSGETGSESKVSVYPNPVTNYQLTITSNDSIADIISFFLYNMKGNLLYSEDVRYSPVTYISLPPYLIKGIYFLKIKHGTNTVIKRIVLI